MSDPTTRLLEAEEVVQALLVELQRLKQEVGSYADARGSLEDAAGQLGQLIENQQRTTSQMLAATQTLSEIGTPEILATTKAAADQLAQLQESQNQANQSSRDALDQVRTDRQESLDAVGEVISQTEQHLTQLVETAESQRREAEAGLGKHLNRWFWVLLTVAVLSLAASAASIVLAFRG